MTNFKLHLSARLADLLDRAGIEKVEDVILKSDLDLKNLVPLTQTDITSIRNTAAFLITRPYGFVTAAEAIIGFHLRWRRLTTGCKILDSQIGGGFACRGITELSGASGVGKTQLCLQAAISVQFPETHGGLKAGAVFIATEDVFPTKRLQQLFKTFPSVFVKQFNDENLQMKPNTFGDNIYIEHIQDADILVKSVVERLPALISSKNIGLIIIDSIGAIFRTEAVSPQRSNKMRAIAMALHTLATKYEVAVICVNQVSAAINREGDNIIPALGLSWANLVTTRIVLSRTETIESESKSTIRHFKTLFSSELSPFCIQYVVTETGIWGVR